MSEVIFLKLLFHAVGWGRRLVYTSCLGLPSFKRFLASSCVRILLSTYTDAARSATIADELDESPVVLPEEVLC